jgi:ketosteroid isomerase-like protein
MMVGWWQARPHQTASPIGTPVAILLDIADGAVHRVRAFLDEEQATDAARED